MRLISARTPSEAWRPGWKEAPSNGGAAGAGQGPADGHPLLLASGADWVALLESGSCEVTSRAHPGSRGGPVLS